MDEKRSRKEVTFFFKLVFSPFWAPLSLHFGLFFNDVRAEASGELPRRSGDAKKLSGGRRDASKTRLRRDFHETPPAKEREPRPGPTLGGVVKLTFFLENSSFLWEYCISRVCVLQGPVEEGIS